MLRQRIEPNQGASQNEGPYKTVTDKTKLKLDREVGGECFIETFEFKIVD